MRYLQKASIFLFLFDKRITKQYNHLFVVLDILLISSVPLIAIIERLYNNLISLLLHFLFESVYSKM